uniref:Uncharacterized protein n=1 Tax=Parascaris equorum TaxID=6256 RepID=A0A914S0R8_PAREQ
MSIAITAYKTVIVIKDRSFKKLLQLRVGMFDSRNERINNGERWEREACTRCRQNGAELEGLACDDTDPARLCIQGKCSNSICHDKPQGSYCDRKMEKICVEDICENPCSRFGSHLMVCDCPAIDPDTGFASDDRCQLCCYDFNIKPASRRCQNAYRRGLSLRPSIILITMLLIFCCLIRI